MVMQRESRLTKFAGYACVFTAVCIICSDIYLFSTEEKTTKSQIARRRPAIREHAQVSRKRLLTNVCSLIKSRESEAWKTYIVDHSKKVAFGWIPKVMSTTLLYCMVYYKPAFRKNYPNLMTSSEDVRFFFSREYGQKTNSTKLHNLRLNEYGLTVPQSLEKLQLINDYFVFTMVRDPFTRLRSAFGNVIRGNQKTIWGVVTKNVKEFHRFRNWSEPITFNDFLEYVVAHRNKTVIGQEHWDTYEKLLDPCHIRFDYIGKIETVQTDLPFIIEKIHEEKSSILLKTVSNQNKKINIDCVYKMIPQKTIFRIVEKYRNDFLMFGYDMNRYSNMSNVKC